MKDTAAGGFLIVLTGPLCLPRRSTPEGQRVSTMWVANSVGTVSVTR